MLRTVNSKRVYPGEKPGWFLVSWLNRTDDRLAKERLACLIETGRELNQLHEGDSLPAVSLNPRRPSQIGTKLQLANAKKASKLIRLLNSLLSKYSVFPRYSGTQKSRWRISWVHTISRHRLRLGFVAGGNYEEVPFGEADAVSSALRLAEEGYLDRLHKCNCGKWFYSRFITQRFCRMRCQQRDFRKTKESLAQRREYMRVYRETLAHRSGRKFKPRIKKYDRKPSQT